MKLHFLERWERDQKELVEKLELFLDHIRSGKISRSDHLVRQKHDEVFAEIDCLDCANCCKTTPALVTGPDVKRIAKYLKIPPRIFKKRYLLEDLNGELSFRQVPCVFLEEDNKCSIYEVRPESCRDYPHTDTGSFRKRARLHQANLSVCPAAFEIVKRLHQ
jgi:Fe-S-cluster containining protein